MKLSVHKNVQDIPYYPKAAMYGHDDGWVRLSSNENPFPPSPRVVSSLLDAVLAINRYPGGEQELKEAIAGRFSVKSDEVIIGNGSNELIEMVLRAMRDDRRKGLLIADPSFAFYSIAAQIYGYETKRVPLADMAVDLEAMHDAIDDGTRIVMLNNPLNPTGTIFEDAPFRRFMERLPADILVVVDEAYMEFSDNPAFPRTLEIINDHPVLVLRTFSKAYGLAGLRVGYGIGDTSFISFLERTKQPFSVNMMALIAALSALNDDDYLQSVLGSLRRSRQYYYEELEKLSLEFVPTETNFILVRIGKKAEEITKRLFDEKIVVRWMGAYGMGDYVRITFGKKEENGLLLAALGRLL